MRNTSEKIVAGIPKPLHTRLHKRLVRRHGNASQCESPECSVINPKNFNWALRKGHQYSDDPADYIQLCISCHRRYDFNEEIRQKLKAKKVGELNNNAKLKNNHVIEIVGLLRKGLSNKVIAAQYGVTPTAICNIKTGKRWSYLTGIASHEQLKQQ